MSKIRRHDLCPNPERPCSCRDPHLYVRTEAGEYRTVCRRSYRQVEADDQTGKAETHHEAAVNCDEPDLAVCMTCSHWEALLGCSAPAFAQRPPLGMHSTPPHQEEAHA